MKISVAGTLLVVTAALPLIITGQNPATRQDGSTSPAVDGAKIFRNNCVACHGTDAKGHGPAAPALRHAPPDLTLIAQRNGGRFPADKVKAVIAGQEQSPVSHGSREMPVWGPVFHHVEWDQDLGEVRLDNITRYLQSIQQK
jgi:mono/diheme cytochrome c family protein